MNGIRYTLTALPCSACDEKTYLPARILLEITQHQTRSSTDAGYVNFVCPHCGLGTRHPVETLETREASLSHGRLRVPIYRAFLECREPLCQCHATVHTIAQGENENAEPKIEVRNWKADAILCSDVHPLKQPIAIREHHVFVWE